MIALADLCGNSASLTDRGATRTSNEDACLERALLNAGLWVVADGMGGHHAGQLASQMIIEALSTISAPSNLSDFIDEVNDRLFGVHQRLGEIAAESVEPMVIGSTVAAFLQFRTQSVCLWAGDSRVYMLRDAKLERLTRDHSEVEALISQGVLASEQAEDHPDANVITRAVGGGCDFMLDTRFQSLECGDRYLLCSDGLYRSVKETEIAELLTVAPATQACRVLVDLALERRCKDNVSVVVVDIARSAPSGPEFAHAHHHGLPDG